MMYFHLNTTNYVDTTTDGLQNIGPIQTNFFCNAFSRLSDAKAYIGSCSEDPMFSHEPTLKGKNWALCSIDDESVEIESQKLIELMEQAHSIVLPIFGKSLIDFGLHYDFVVKISNRQVEAAWADYLAENNLEYVEESIGNRNMSLPEKIDFFSSELIKIGSSGNQLTIVDPYIFPKRHDGDYCDLFLGIIHAAEVSSIKIITDQRKYDASVYNSIQSKLSEESIPICTYFSENYHDRWWIIENKKVAIMCGTSLNGFGKGKPSTIIPLTDQDVEKIIADISVVCE